MHIDVKAPHADRREEPCPMADLRDRSSSDLRNLRPLFLVQGTIARGGTVMRPMAPWSVPNQIWRVVGSNVM